MSERTYYVICGDNCKFESLTKEQILSAISQATGETTGGIDVDDAFITKVKELNNNTALQFSICTQAEYNTYVENDEIVANCLYIISDETTITDLETEVETLSNDFISLTDSTSVLINSDGSYAQNARASQYCGVMEKRYLAHTFSTPDANNRVTETYSNFMPANFIPDSAFWVTAYVEVTTGGAIYEAGDVITIPAKVNTDRSLTLYGSGAIGELTANIYFNFSYVHSTEGV